MFNAFVLEFVGRFQFSSQAGYLLGFKQELFQYNHTVFLLACNVCEEIALPPDWHDLKMACQQLCFNT